MSENKRKTGSIELSALEHKMATMDGQDGIFIPFHPNPSIYVGQKSDGREKVVLDIEYKDTPKGHAPEMIKAKVTSDGYKRLNLKNADRETWDRYTPILGHTYEKGSAQKPEQAAPASDDYDDLPPDNMPSDLAGDWNESQEASAG